jgi:hypothetical protein
VRVRDLRGAGLPVIGTLSVELEDGLTAFLGGDGRGLRTVQDSLLWAAGLRGSVTGSEGRSQGSGDEAGVDLRLEIMDESVFLKAGGEPGAAFDASRARLTSLVGLASEDLAILWAGHGVQGSTELLRKGSWICAGFPSFRNLIQAITRMATDFPSLAPGGLSTAEDDERLVRRLRLEAELEDLATQLHALEDAPERLRELEDELGRFRFDSAEITGDLEVQRMEWLRERQDAETHLQAYRDRARELRERIRKMESAGPDSPCPTCGRILGDHYQEVMAELQEEWESIVQDGKWWRRRWEQLEMKPASLQEIESRAVQHNADLEECTERVERCRAEVRELDELRQRQRDVEGQLAIEVADGAPEASEEPDESSSPERALVYATMTALRDEAVRVARHHLVLRAGHYLNAISGGRLLGMGVGEEGKVMLLDGGIRVGPVSEEERAAAFLSIRLALAESVAERSDGRFGSLLIGHPVDRLGEEAQHRFTEVLRSVLPTIPQILLFTRGHLVDLAPEAFDAILELRTEGAAGPTTIRALPSGMGVLRLRS